MLGVLREEGELWGRSGVGGSAEENTEEVQKEGTGGHLGLTSEGKERQAQPSRRLTFVVSGIPHEGISAD